MNWDQQSTSEDSPQEARPSLVRKQTTVSQISVKLSRTLNLVSVPVIRSREENTKPNARCSLKRKARSRVLWLWDWVSWGSGKEGWSSWRERQPWLRKSEWLLIYPGTGERHLARHWCELDGQSQTNRNLSVIMGAKLPSARGPEAYAPMVLYIWICSRRIERALIPVKWIFSLPRRGRSIALYHLLVWLWLISSS